MAEDTVIVVDNEFCKVACYPKKRLISLKWNKYCALDDFRDVMTKAADAFEKHRCIKWLSDDTRFGAVHPDDREWGNENFAPRMIKAGWKFHAMVLPKSAVGSLSLTGLINHIASLGVKAQIFSDIDEAEAWLESKGTLGIMLG